MGATGLESTDFKLQLLQHRNTQNPTQKIKQLQNNKT